MTQLRCRHDCSLRNSSINKKTMLKRDLQRQTGLLQFATSVVKPGRPFLRQLHAIQDIGHHPTHNVRLNVSARADSVVASVYRALEWHFFPMEFQETIRRHHNFHRYFWFVGMQSLLGDPLATAPVAFMLKRFIHSNKRAHTCCTGCSYIWSSVVQESNSFGSGV